MPEETNSEKDAKPESRWKSLIGCCCLAPLVCGAILAIATIVAVWLLQDALTALIPALALKAGNWLFELVKNFVAGFLSF